MKNELYHYGTKRHSGRYPWGSGEVPFQHEAYFLAEVRRLQKEGLSEKEIANGMGMTVNQLRARKSIAKDEQRAADIAEIERLRSQGMNTSEIARQMGKNESSIRALTKAGETKRVEITKETIDILKQSVDSQKYIDVGSGVAEGMGVSETRLKTAIQALKDDGYELHEIQVEQSSNPGHYTTVKVLSEPGHSTRDIWADRENIGMVNFHFDDNYEVGYSPNFDPKKIQDFNSKKLKINYAEDGGTEKDGVIEVRRGVDILDMGNSRYAQVRIRVDGTHYLKGMAIYADDLPDGVDIRFNTNKSKGTPALGDKDNTVLKPIKGDPDNPFGASITRQHGCLNIVNEEGKWDTWSRSLASQMLSKQSPQLAKQQLDYAAQDRVQSFNDILALTNPSVKRHMLNQFADECDSAAEHLKAAAMPRQSSYVILPVNSLKPTEIYAPGYKNGEKVVAIRYPHGGTFEIPELTVNNNNKEARRLFENARDAVGIHHSVAARLSGADFDGDSVIIIPNNDRRIKTTAALEGLKDFDPHTQYAKYPGMPVIKERTKQTEMGKISNLITDMTIKGASTDEIVRAVRHSMVVIDAEKHELNYKQSYIDNGIAELKEKYQGGKQKGASTLISRATSQQRVPQRKLLFKVDPKTGEKIYEETGAHYTNKKGKVVYKTQKSTKMAETNDARTLSSGTEMENIYADHANRMKTLANQARKEALAVKDIAYSPKARETYRSEVDSLDAKLRLAKQNSPRERKAQLIASTIVAAKKKDNPELEGDDLKKVRAQAIATARARTGAKKALVQIEDREWEAIQAGAISKTKLSDILKNADQDQVKKLATPKSANIMSNSKVAMARARLDRGYTLDEVATSMGVTVSVLKNNLYPSK